MKYKYITAILLALMISGPVMAESFVASLVHNSTKAMPCVKVGTADSKPEAVAQEVLDIFVEEQGLTCSFVVQRGPYFAFWCEMKPNSFSVFVWADNFEACAAVYQAMYEEAEFTNKAL